MAALGLLFLSRCVAVTQRLVARSRTGFAVRVRRQ